jgi:putative transcriptional regulator
MGDTTHMGTGFGSQLKQLRTNAKLSQSELADRAKMNAAGIAKLEQGVREPSWATVLTLAAALGVSVESFVPPRPGRQDRSPPNAPAKRVRPAERRLDDATALLRSVQDQPHDRTAWGVLADWLEERNYQAGLYCRRRFALLDHEARRPNDLPTGRHNRERRHQIYQAWTDERGEIDRRWGPATKGEYAKRPIDVLWILWGDPGTTRTVRAGLYLHNCRGTANPRALVDWLLRALPENGGPLYLQALDLVRRYVAGEEIPAECPERLRGNALRHEPHYSSIRGGYDVLAETAPYDTRTFVQRSAPAGAARLVEGIYSRDPITDLYGDSERLTLLIPLDLEGDRPGTDELDVNRNPFAPPT